MGEACLPCPNDEAATTGLGVVGAILGIAIVTFVVRRSVLGNPKSISSVATKIFLNYAAVLGQLS